MTTHKWYFTKFLTPEVFKNTVTQYFKNIIIWCRFGNITLVGTLPLLATQHTTASYYIDIEPQINIISTKYTTVHSKDFLDLDFRIYLFSNIQIHKSIYYILETKVFLNNCNHYTNQCLVKKKILILAHVLVNEQFLKFYLECLKSPIKPIEGYLAVHSR